MSLVQVLLSGMLFTIYLSVGEFKSPIPGDVVYPWRRYPGASYGLLLYFQLELHKVSAICLEFSGYLHMG